MARKYPKNYLVEDTDVRRINELSNAWGISNSAAMRKSILLCHQKFVANAQQRQAVDAPTN